MKKRKITSSLYLFLAALFIFGATFLAIIISQGGSVTDEGVFTNSGVLRINVDPENIPFTLYVDDKSVDNLVNKGTNIEAGIHTIRIESAGMINWEKRISIRQGIVTDILAKLFPSDLKLEQMTNSNISKAVFSSYGDYIFYIVKDSLIESEQGIWRLQLGQNGLFFFNSPAVPTKFALLDEQIEEMLLDPELIMRPSPDHNKMLMLSPLTQKIILLNNLNSNDSVKILDIMSEIGFYPKHVDWLNDSTSLLIDDEKTIFEYDLTNNKTTLIKYDPQQPVVYGYNQTQLIWYDRIKKTLNIYKNQLNQALLINSIELSEETIQDIILPKNSARYIALKTATKYLFLDIEKTTLYAFDLPVADYILIDISPDSTTFLFRDNLSKLHTIVAKENIGLNQMEIKNYELNLSMFESDKIKFGPSGSNIFLYNNQNRTILSVEQDGGNMTTLVNNEMISSIFGFDSQLSSLFLLIQDGNDQEDTQSPSLPVTNLYGIDLRLAN